MPKMKSHSGAKKRFKKTATGKLRARHANSSHILEKKSPKRKRSFGLDRNVSDHDRKTAKGKLRGRRAYSSHILEKKSPARKRRFKRPVEIAKPDQKRVNELLGGKGR